MATPMKAFYCQVVRTRASSLCYNAAQSQAYEVPQWQRARPLSKAMIPGLSRNRHNRPYSTTPRLGQSRRRNEDSTEVQETEDENEPQYNIDESRLSSIGHGELEQHREIRNMMRTAAWEMPLLTQLAQPFERDTTGLMPLKWRYTTYMGDSHPASRKVMVSFKIHCLPDLTAEQRLKMQKLVGARLNPQTNVVRMSCESFETQAQNKRYLGDTIQKLLAEVRDPNADSFEDVPLDTRHHKFRKRPRYPREWLLTRERKAQLEEQRGKSLLEEGKREENGQVVSGVAAIEAARQLKLKQAEEQPVLVEPKSHHVKRTR